VEGSSSLSLKAARSDAGAGVAGGKIHPDELKNHMELSVLG